MTRFILIFHYHYHEKIDKEDEKELNKDESTMAVNFDSTNNVGPTVKDAIIRKKQQFQYFEFFFLSTVIE